MYAIFNQVLTDQIWITKL